MGENKRVAKNTLFLYFRMLFVMGVAIYSSRIVLNILGVSDYGLYNVVGGFVAMLSFLNGAAGGATSRYLIFYLGRKELDKFQQVFSAAFFIHLGIAIVIFILAETIGLWFLYEKMTIDPVRLEAATWVYHLSVLSCFVTFTQVPYNASLISHERMGVYAYVGVVEAVLKLGVLYLLSVSPYDKLKSYAFLLLAVSVSIALFYRSYCRHEFNECRISHVRDKRLFKELLSYAGWDTLGSITGIAQTQGINVVLNMFFGTIVNAARGVAFQVDAAVQNFIQNFLTAINPQIVKAYASGNIGRTLRLMFFSGKYTFLMFSCMAVPVMIEAPYLLKIWLKNPPEYSTPFLRLVMLNHFISILCQVINVVVHATGDVKRLNIYAGTISIMKLPIAYILLKCGLSPIWVFIGVIPISCVCLWADMRVLYMNILYDRFSFIWNALFKNILFMIVPVALSLYVSLNFEVGFVKLSFVTLSYVISLGIILYTIGISIHEREIVNKNIVKVYNKILRK